MPPAEMPPAESPPTESLFRGKDSYEQLCCTLCDITTVSEVMFTKHLKTRMHNRNLKNIPHNPTPAPQLPPQAKRTRQSDADNTHSANNQNQNNNNNNTNNVEPTANQPPPQQQNWNNRPNQQYPPTNAPQIHPQIWDRRQSLPPQNPHPPHIHNANNRRLSYPPSPHPNNLHNTRFPNQLPPHNVQQITQQVVQQIAQNVTHQFIQPQHAPQVPPHLLPYAHPLVAQGLAQHLPLPLPPHLLPPPPPHLLPFLPPHLLPNPPPHPSNNCNNRRVSCPPPGPANHSNNFNNTQQPSTPSIRPEAVSLTPFQKDFERYCDRDLYADDRIYCTLCRATCQTDEAYSTHVGEPFHVRQLQLRNKRRSVQERKRQNYGQNKRKRRYSDPTGQGGAYPKRQQVQLAYNTPSKNYTSERNDNPSTPAQLKASTHSNTPTKYPPHPPAAAINNPEAMGPPKQQGNIHAQASNVSLPNAPIQHNPHQTGNMNSKSGNPLAGYNRRKSDDQGTRVSKPNISNNNNLLNVPNNNVGHGQARQSPHPTLHGAPANKSAQPPHQPQLPRQPQLGGVLPAVPRKKSQLPRASGTIHKNAKRRKYALSYAHQALQPPLRPRIFRSVDPRIKPFKMKEWLAMHKNVHESGNQVDILAFKVMLELLLDPINGVPIRHLSKISDAMLRAERLLRPDDRLSEGHAGVATVLNALKETNNSQNKNDANEKQQAREALGLLVDNVRYIFNPNEHMEKVKERKRATELQMPTRGSWGIQSSRQYRAEPHRAHSVKPSRRDSFGNDPLFLTIMRKQLARTH